MLVVKDAILESQSISDKFDTVQDLVNHLIELKYDLIVTNKPENWTEIILCDHSTGKQFNKYLVSAYQDKN